MIDFLIRFPILEITITDSYSFWGFFTGIFITYQRSCEP